MASIPAKIRVPAAIPVAAAAAAATGIALCRPCRSHSMGHAPPPLAPYRAVPAHGQSPHTPAPRSRPFFSAAWECRWCLTAFS
jgi:hypothetical protein